MSTIKPFTSLQKAHIASGEIYHKKFLDAAEYALGIKKLNYDPKQHWYFVGGAGIGKSTVISSLAKQHKIPLVEFYGESSMNAFTVRLATAVYLSKGKRIYVWIDDCDSIFKDQASLSVMKGALNVDRNVLQWNKNLITQITQYENSTNPNEQLIAEALRSYQIKGGVGVCIPTDNVTFIIMSNHELAPSNPMPKSPRLIDESTIRDRIHYKAFIPDKNTMWGWVAFCALKYPLGGINKAMKHYLLDWMYENWDRLASTSLREINDLAADTINFPNDYPDYWENRLKPKK